MSNFNADFLHLSQVDTTMMTLSVGRKSLSKGGDVIALAFYLLLEASKTGTETALIHAKELNNNALSQENLNRQEEKLEFVDVPKEQVDVHHHVTHVEQNLPTPDGGCIHKSWTYKWTTKSYPNANAVLIAESKNKQIMFERQKISQELTMKQQEANISEQQVYSIGQEARQTMQEGSTLNNLLRSMVKLLSQNLS